MVNTVVLVGRLTRDAELVDAAQTPMTRMRVVTDHGYRDAEGVWQEKPEFHSVVAFGRLAEVCAAYGGKGRLVYLSGRLRSRDYDGSDGLRRHTTEVVAEVMKLLGRAPSGPTGTTGIGSDADASSVAPASEASDDDTAAIDTDPLSIAGATEARRGNGRRPAATASS